MFQLEIQSPLGWHRLARYEDLADARLACDRAVLSEKCTSRLIELIADDHSLQQLAGFGLNVIYERHYNIRMDPDENWRDEVKNMEEEDGLRWQESGF